MTWDELSVELRRRAEVEGGDMFMGWPDRWYAAPHPHFRCPNDHVSVMVLKSEALGRDVCMACYQPVILTFPEDRDGPL